MRVLDVHERIPAPAFGQSLPEGGLVSRGTLTQIVSIALFAELSQTRIDDIARHNATLKTPAASKAADRRRSGRLARTSISRSERRRQIAPLRDESPPSSAAGGSVVSAVRLAIVRPARRS
jgi:hypothetical protein